MWEVAETSGGYWLIPSSIRAPKYAAQFKIGKVKFYCSVVQIAEACKPYLEAICKVEPRVIADSKLHIWIQMDGTYQVQGRSTRGTLGAPTKAPSATPSPQNSARRRKR
jgi:hypothetical protein